MFDLLYSIHVPFKAVSLPELPVLSMVLKWCTASSLSFHMVDDIRCDKTLNTTLKNAHLVPGAYIDDILPSATPYPRPPSAPKLSLPGPGISVMPCTEIRGSPVQDDCCASQIKSLPEDSQDDDTAGYTSEESHADTTLETDLDGEDEFEHRRSSTYDNQRFEVGQRAPLVPPKQLPVLPPIPTDKLSRKVPPLKRVLSRVFSENGAEAKSSTSMTSIFSKAQHDLTHLFTRHDLIHLADSRGTSSSSCDDSSAEVSPSPSIANYSQLPGVVTVTDIFDHPTHTVTRTVIRPTPSHSVFSLPLKRPSSSRGPKSLFRTPESMPVPDTRSVFEEELDTSLRRWEDEREGRNAMDIYVVVGREAAHEESWRSLIQEIHYDYHPPSRKFSSECGRW